MYHYVDRFSLNRTGQFCEWSYIGVVKGVWDVLPPRVSSVYDKWAPRLLFYSANEGEAVGVSFCAASWISY